MPNDVKLTTSERAGRRCASTGSAWEPRVGYSRAVRSGSTIAVSGTVGVNSDGTYAPSAAEQTRRALTLIIAAVEALGGKPQHIIRTRIFVRHINHWESIGQVHAEFFAEIRPACTLVEISALVDAEALVEIEADAVVPD